MTEDVRVAFELPPDGTTVVLLGEGKDGIVLTATYGLVRGRVFVLASAVSDQLPVRDVLMLSLADWKAAARLACEQEDHGKPH